MIAAPLLFLIMPLAIAVAFLFGLWTVISRFTDKKVSSKEKKVMLQRLLVIALLWAIFLKFIHAI